MKEASTQAHKSQRGISYVEVLIASAIIAVSLVPAMEALNASVRSNQLSATLQAQHFLLLEKYEELMAQSFDTLDAEALSLADQTTASTLFSDPSGTSNRRLVYLQRFDADNLDNDDNPFTGGDGGLCWLRVEIAGTSINREVLVSKY